MYNKAKLHKGPQSKCSVCMNKLRAQDPGFYEKISAAAKFEAKMAEKKARQMQQASAPVSSDK